MKNEEELKELTRVLFAEMFKLLFENLQEEVEASKKQYKKYKKSCPEEYKKFIKTLQKSVDKIVENETDLLRDDELWASDIDEIRNRHSLNRADIKKFLVKQEKKIDKRKKALKACKNKVKDESK